MHKCASFKDMFLKLIHLLVFTVVVVPTVSFHYKNDTDECDGQKTTCTALVDCKWAKEFLLKNKTPQNCGFDGKTPKVCCPTSAKLRLMQSGDFIRDACANFKKPLTTIARSGDYSTNDFDSISGGVLALEMEFKHMALIGFGNDAEKIWLCGGSLIHEKYVLTAAHCLHSRLLGRVNYVRLGDLDYKTNEDNSQYQDFNVTQIFKHPNYTYPATYNDIALLKLDRAAVFDYYVQPACLHTEKEINTSIGDLVVAGWGKTEALAYNGSSQLRKAMVTLFPYDICSQIYRKDSRRLTKGIVEDLQLCAGSVIDESNTCEGDSGGPLELDEMFSLGKVSTIVGITSFGKACGFKGIPGVYTRVSGYTDWIENIVWKDK